MPQLDFCIYKFVLLTISFNVLIIMFYIIVLNVIFFLSFINNFLNIFFLDCLWSMNNFFKLVCLKFKKLNWLFINVFVMLPVFLSGFQSPGNVTMGILISYHNDVWYYLISILFVVIWCLSVAIYKFRDIDFEFYSSHIHYYFTDFSEIFDSCLLLEFSWTVLPSIFLINGGSPGISLLYSIEEATSSPEFTLKAIGSQWFWTYEYITESGKYLKFDSCPSKVSPCIGRESFTKLHLEVDRRVYIPIDSKVKLLTTSTDVIHAWAIPALGIKLDAVPGRINQTEFTIDRPGIYRGQCSEFCGTGHGNMPIVVVAVPSEVFKLWISFQT